MAEAALLEEIRARVEQAFQDQIADIDVSTDGYYVNVSVVSSAFEGLRPVARQQMVYRALTDLITAGTLHAVNIKASAPREN